MSAGEKHGFEPWARGAFALGGGTAGLYLYLGLRPGGAAPILAYRYGLLFLGWASAVGMLAGMLWSLRRRPVLQRRRAWALSVLGATLWFCSLPLPYPSSHEGKFSPTRYRLPFEGKARVRYGGEHKAWNPLLFDPARRFGTGFERTGDEPLVVLSPGAGTVRTLGRGRGGEFVVLEIAEREFCVVEGLDEGSIGLAPGATVVPGAALGCASGTLFVHLQDEPEEGHGEGIPMRYWGYSVDGRLAESGVPIPPQEVESAPLSFSEAPAGR